MDNCIFSDFVRTLLAGEHVFGSVAEEDESTKSMLERVKDEMEKAMASSEGMGDVYKTYSNAVNSADYLLALIECGKFPEDNTPYSISWGKTFDYITGSCLNIAYGYMLLQQYTNGDENVSKIDLGGLSEELEESDCLDGLGDPDGLVELDVNILADDGDNTSEIDDPDDDDDYYCRRRGISDCCDVCDCCCDIHDC